MGCFTIAPAKKLFLKRSVPRGVSLEKISYTFAKISNENLLEKSKNLIRIPKICKQF